MYSSTTRLSVRTTIFQHVDVVAAIKGLREDFSRLSREVETLRSEVHRKSHRVSNSSGK